MARTSSPDTVKRMRSIRALALGVPVVWSVLWFGFLRGQFFGEHNPGDTRLLEGLMNLSTLPGFVVAMVIIGVGAFRLTTRGLYALETMIGRRAVTLLLTVAMAVLLFLYAKHAMGGQTGGSGSS